jgi:Histidine kinase-, DNA gyrase B-, and HSP90-like ATPase
MLPQNSRYRRENDLGPRLLSPPSPIELRATRRRERIRIEVVDHGYGIHPDDMTRIVEKFGRGRDQGGRHVAGMGLGLYLSRRIVQAHGSELTVESVPGVGSVFGFDLPVAPALAGESAGEGAPIRVLIVDDHASFRQPLSLLLAPWPAVSESIYYGSAIFRRGKPDLFQSTYL